MFLSFFFARQKRIVVVQGQNSISLRQSPQSHLPQKATASLASVASVVTY